MNARVLTITCLCALGSLVTACDDDGPGDTPVTAGAAGGGEKPLAPCLERPDDLPRPPIGALTCDLVPPDFGS
jgi:hypothetical protein